VERLPATGRSALQDLRSCAILQASLALSPVSSSICCTHVRQGRPRWRFHSGLMSGLPPVRQCERPQPGVVWSGLVSLPLQSMHKNDASRKRLRSASTSALITPSSCRTMIGDRTFFVAAPRVWNTMPSSVTASETLSAFKCRQNAFFVTSSPYFSQLRSPDFILYSDFVK